MPRGSRTKAVLDELEVPEVYRAAPERPRPYEYTEALAEALCRHIALCKSVASFCALPGMPAERTIYRWLRDYPAFVQNYVRAREDAAFRVVDEILDIADREDLAPRDKAVRIEARKWIASRHAPKVYGDIAGRLPPTSELVGSDQERRRELRQALLRELSDLARPAPLVIEQDGGGA